MLAKLADFSYRRRWTVVALWVLALVGVSLAAGQLGGEWRGGARLDGTDAQRAYDLLDRKLPSRAGDFATVVFAVPEGIQTARPELAQFVAKTRTLHGIVRVSSPLADPGQRSADGKVVFATVEFDRAGAWDISVPLAPGAASLARHHVVVEYSGSVFEAGGLPATEGFGLLAAAVILLIALGSVVAAGLPLITAVVGIGIGLGSVSLWATVVDTPDFTVQTASMIGIGVGIDYALFIVTRFREARTDGHDVRAAIAEAATTAGRAVVFAGLTVMVSLLGMILMRLKFLNGLAVGTSTSVAVAVGAAVTLLPALLAIAGNRIRPIGSPTRHRRGPTFWERWSRHIQRRPVAAASAGLFVLCTLAVPVAWMRLGSADAGSSARSQTTRRAYDLLAQGFTPGFAGPLILAADTPSAGARAALSTVASMVRSTPGVAYVSEPQLNADASAAALTVIPATSPQDEATEVLLHHLRTYVLPAAVAGTDARVYVGGQTASDVDFAGFIGRRMPYFIGAVLTISFLLLLAMFRSILVPLKAVVLNLLSIGAAYGVMVAVFQWGWFGSLLGLGRGAPIAPWAPMLLFAIVFGLSMDYEVFLLSKIRERFDATGDNSAAVAEGVAHTGRVISAAAAIMVVVFGLFAAGSLRDIQLIGVGLATAVFIDATVVRLILVPATMELLGARNWWMPKWVDRLIPHLHVDATRPSIPGPILRASR